ncbi:DNA polymerase epsilon catalytic subunit, partial [Phlyctochytrium bullatum]
KLCDDLGIAVDGPLILVIAWKINAGKMGRFLQAEWISGMRSLGISSNDQLKKQFPSFQKVLSDVEALRPLYKWVFNFSREGEERYIDVEIAKGLWKLLLTHSERFKHVDSFIEFLNDEKAVKVINRDQWEQFYEFSMQVPLDCSNYDESGALQTFAVRSPLSDKMDEEHGEREKKAEWTDPREMESASHEFEMRMGFSYLNEEKRLGWLFNMNPVTYTIFSFLTRLKTTIRARDGKAQAGVDLYFVEEDGSTFKAALPYNPYFYIICKASPGTETEMETILRMKFDRFLITVELVEKEDLSLPNHLAGAKRRLLKLVFANVKDLMHVRKFALAAARRSKAMLSDLAIGQDNYESFDGLTIEDVREYDVIYYTRLAIDQDVRVGYWYEVSESKGRTDLTIRKDRVKRADPVVFAFDIETTKMPLKFPVKAYDKIMMISYMVDGRGYLITNREIVSEDISDFEYTPKPEYEGEFHVFNEENEVIANEVRPNILVTYNGDFFDMDFVDARAKVYSLDMRKEIGFWWDEQNEEYRARYAVHIDAFYWVKRDSYLPQGSQGLKAVTKYKLGYNPIEVDPEDMTRFAAEKPQILAQYSVSDAVATYYLYMKYVHPFIFSLCNIIPMNPDDILRRGSGTLCETLLMVEAYKANVIMPNKHQDDIGKTYKGHLLETETYVGGHVEALEAGVFRSDLPMRFNIDSEACDQLISEVDQALRFSIEVECKLKVDDVENYDEVRSEIISQLESLKQKPETEEFPLIYHLDVAAMYPNIILTNRLQPDAIVLDSDCAACDFYEGTGSLCQRRMQWSWRGEFYPAEASELNMIKSQMERELFPGRHPNEAVKRPFRDMSLQEQNEAFKQRVEVYSKKVYAKKLSTEVLTKESIVCQRENPFYVNTVRSFRDRRYEYKGLHKVWKGNLDKAVKEGSAQGAEEAKKLIVVYDSLQLAHKCILNSFYGYVMRKGARWFSMEMAGIVCLTGAKIIQLARRRIEKLGRPLELDTDGIWCALPKSFPENFLFKLKSGKKLSISYPCVMLNHLVHAEFTNHQYQELHYGEYMMRSENSIFFEVDGPYRAMILPASTDEDKLLKKRYAVFSEDGSLAELKGFEIKRRGELQLIKIFQSEIFKIFLEGKTLEECYNSVAKVADQWLDVLYSRGKDLSDVELISLISENRSMSKLLEAYGSQKSTSISTAKRLAEFLGEEMVKDKGLNCQFVISLKPFDLPVSERAIPVSIFAAEESIRRYFLRKWLKDPSLDTVNIRDILDWQYYLDRFSSVIQKLITIPAAMQNVANPVARVKHPDWLLRKLARISDEKRQRKITSMFAKLSNHPKELEASDKENDSLHKRRKVVEIEDLGAGTERRLSTRPAAKDIAPTENVDTVMSNTVSTRPPPIDGEYRQWLLHQKKKWRTRQFQKEAGIHKMAPKSQLGSWAAKITSGETLFIVQVLESEVPGEVMFWVYVTGSLHSIRLEMKRIFYINCRKDCSMFITNTNGLKVSNSTKKLPRGQKSAHLYEVEASETYFRAEEEELRNSLAHYDIEGVYETRIPLSYRAVLHVGDKMSFRRPGTKTGSRIQFSDFRPVKSLSRLVNHTDLNDLSRPDIGGKEKDQHDNLDLNQTEESHAGSYSDFCFEIELYNVAFNAASQWMQLNLNDRFLLTNSNPELNQHTVNDQCDVEPFEAGNAGDAILHIVRELIQMWHAQYTTGKSQYAELMLEHFDRWLTARTSKFYDPSLYLKISKASETLLSLLCQYRQEGN